MVETFVTLPCPISGHEFRSYLHWQDVLSGARTVTLYYRAPLDMFPRPVEVRRIYKNGKMRLRAGDVTFTADPGHLPRIFRIVRTMP